MNLTTRINRTGSRPAWLTRAVLVASLAGWLVQAAPAHALQGGEDPSTLPVLVDKQHGSSGTHQLTLSYSGVVLTDYTTGIGGSLAYQYGITDLFGLELSGAFYGTGETSLMKNIRADFSGTGEPELSDMFAQKYNALLNVVFVPIYGKLSFASELDPSFDVYVLAGGGMVGVERKAGLDGDLTESKTTFAFDWGVGMRFYISRLIALRLEYRSVYFPEPGKYDDPVSGLTSMQYFQGGLQFTFGGDS